MNEPKIAISALEIRSTVAPESSNGLPIAGYIFEYFETSVTLRDCTGRLIHQGHVCILYKPGEIALEGSPRPGRRTWFHVHGDGLDDVLNRYSVPVNRVMMGASGALSLIPFMEEVGRHLIHRGHFWEDAITLLCRRFFRNLGRAVNQSVDQSEPSLYQQETISMLRRLRAQIHSNLRHRWTIEDMSALAHLSPAYYRQLYTDHFRISPIDDVISARIRRAKLLMQLSDLTIDQIAEECGFNSTPQFHGTFRKRAGLTPGAYLRIARQSISRDTPRTTGHRGDPLDDIALLYEEPAGYWSFDDEDGPFDEDYHFRYGPVKLLHGATIGDGPWGRRALNLDGKMAHAEVAAAVVDTAQSFSVCAWVRIGDGPPSSEWMTAISISDGSHCSFYLQYCVPKDCYMFTMTPSDTNFNTIHATGMQPGVKNEWVHICGVYDREGQKMSLWENGKRTNTLDVDSAWTAPAPTRFGAGVFWGQIADIWLGAIAEIRIYARVLHDEEVRRIYDHRRPIVDVSG